MQIETNKDMPMDISIMLNCADIDKLIGRLQRLKSNPEEHFDIFCTDFENDPAISVRMECPKSPAGCVSIRTGGLEICLFSGKNNNNIFCRGSLYKSASTHSRNVRIL